MITIKLNPIYLIRGITLIVIGINIILVDYLKQRKKRKELYDF